MRTIRDAMGLVVTVYLVLSILLAYEVYELCRNGGRLRLGGYSCLPGDPDDQANVPVPRVPKDRRRLRLRR